MNPSVCCLALHALDVGDTSALLGVLLWRLKPSKFCGRRLGVCGDHCSSLTSGVWNCWKRQLRLVKLGYLPILTNLLIALGESWAALKHASLKRHSWWYGSLRNECRPSPGDWSYTVIQVVLILATEFNNMTKRNAVLLTTRTGAFEENMGVFLEQKKCLSHTLGLDRRI